MLLRSVLFVAVLVQSEFAMGQDERKEALGTLGETYLNFLSLFGGDNSRRDVGDNVLARSRVQEKEGNGRGECATSIFKFGAFNEMKISARSKGLCTSCCQPKQGRDLRFMLYNKKSRSTGVEIVPQMRNGSCSRAGVITDIPTIIFVHGFTETSPGFSGREIVDAYLSRPEPYNVILLDWSELCTFPWYLESYRNVKLVANALRRFLEFYNDNGEIPIGNVHIVGFSLGAHVAGFAGKTLRKGLRIPRITGLDPAFPEFSIKDASQRLTYTDADFVDVIHTDSGILGFPTSIGHADFYPNGGRALQPGCQLSYLATISLFDQMFACSHIRAWKLYAESVANPEAFPATKCRMWRGNNKKCEFKLETFMGFPATKNNAKGSYYLLTKHKPPFSKSVQEQIMPMKEQNVR